MNEILNSYFKRSCQGRRLYREKRGVWHVQDLKNPSKAIYTGSLREIERILKGKSIKIKD